MTEMRAAATGQYGQNNQPSHHLLALFTALGDREATERWTRLVLDHCFGTDFYAGGSGLGELSGRKVAGCSYSPSSAQILLTISCSAVILLIRARVFSRTLTV